MNLKLLSNDDAAAVINELRKEHGLDTDELLSYYEGFIYRLGFTPVFAEYLKTELGNLKKAGDLP